MPTFKSGAFAQQCFSSHPLSLAFKALTLITPAGQTELARPGALFNLRDGINQPVEKPSTSDPPTISPARPGSAETEPFSPAPAATPSLLPDVPVLGPQPESAGTDTAPVYRVVVTCNACDMRHRFAIQTLTSRLGQREERDIEAISQLSSCATAHCLDLRVSSMDVINDSVGLRCGECHRAYHLGVSAIETYQKQ
jgi:hypothetical protein